MSRDEAAEVRALGKELGAVRRELEELHTLYVPFVEAVLEELPGCYRVPGPEHGQLAVIVEAVTRLMALADSTHVDELTHREDCSAMCGD